MNIKTLALLLNLSTYIIAAQNTPITEFSFILNLSTIPGAGIGMFATHVISKDTIINFFPPNYPFRILQKNHIPPAFLKLTIALENDLYMCPDRFDCIETSWYINHSFSPNVRLLTIANMLQLKIYNQARTLNGL